MPDAHKPVEKKDVIRDGGGKPGGYDVIPDGGGKPGGYDVTPDDAAGKK
jgi:hypothetical protein